MRCICLLQCEFFVQLSFLIFSCQTLRSLPAAAVAVHHSRSASDLHLGRQSQAEAQTQQVDRRLVEDNHLELGQSQAQSFEGLRSHLERVVDVQEDP